MAIIEYGPLANEVSGSIGGVTFARTHDAKTCRGRRRPVNKRSQDQGERRRVLALYSSRWFESLTAAQRAAWVTYAATCNFTDALGKNYTISGHNMFVRTNALLNYLDGSEDLVAPVGVGFPTTRVLTLQLVHATGVFSVQAMAPAGLAADRIHFKIYNFDRSSRNHLRTRFVAGLSAPGNFAIPFTVHTYVPAPPGAAASVNGWLRFWYEDSDNRITTPDLYAQISS